MTLLHVFRNFLPQHAPEILVHAIKHDYPRLISATLPHFARLPLIPVMEKLPLLYLVPWVCFFFLEEEKSVIHV